MELTITNVIIHALHLEWRWLLQIPKRSNKNKNKNVILKPHEAEGNNLK
jgi:hypothetical protein